MTQTSKRRRVTLNIDVLADLTGYGAARVATPAHHQIVKHYASPLLMGPPASELLLELVVHLYTEDEADLVRHLPPLRARTAAKVAPVSPAEASPM